MVAIGQCSGFLTPPVRAAGGTTMLLAFRPSCMLHITWKPASMSRRQRISPHVHQRPFRGTAMRTGGFRTGLAIVQTTGSQAVVSLREIVLKKPEGRSSTNDHRWLRKKERRHLHALCVWSCVCQFQLTEALFAPSFSNVGSKVRACLLEFLICRFIVDCR